MPSALQPLDVCSPYVPVGQGATTMILDQTAIADALRSAPAWALVGLTMPEGMISEDARLEVAGHLVSALTRPDDRDQLALPL